MTWIERLEAAAKASTDWNTPAERDRTLELMERARKEFETRKSGG